MKKIMMAAIAVSLLASCTQVAGWFGSKSDSASTTSVDSSGSIASISRDASITKENAYSDLFLDSNTVENYIRKENLSGGSAQMMRNFYNVRNNEFAWFTSTGLTEQGRGLWSLASNEKEDKSKKGNQGIKQRMDSLLQNDSVAINTNDSSIVQTELGLTRTFVDLANSNQNNINRNNFYYLVPVKKQDPMQLADSLLHKQKDSAQYASNKGYTALRQQLSIYYDIAKNGGWQPIPSGAINKGSKTPAVSALKKRLQATHDYPGTDTTAAFTDSLANAVKDVQTRYGLKATGQVNDSLIQALNVPVQERIQQILVNMNRMEWMPPATDSNRIMVNIPSQMLYTYEANNKVMEMPVIVGKDGASTTSFSGNINQVIFNPTWHVPSSIVKNELMPKMKSDPGYLQKHHMEVTGQSDSVPQVKQLPGKDNALGRVKFVFPNSYDIYLHDTPDKTLFQRNDRALSHGCIRVANAEKLAEYLLRNQQDWNAQKIQSAMKSTQEQTVSVSNPELVQITYNTAWVDENGKMNFRPDIYNHDKEASSKMFVMRSA
jgi:L,D-transpeptidase YcbB